MNNKLKRFMCEYFYPFCGLKLKNVKHAFDSDGSEIELTANDKIKNNAARTQNLEILRQRGGLKKYVINWTILLALFIFIVDFGIEPTTSLEKLPIAIVGFFLVPAWALILLLWYFIEQNPKNTLKGDNKHS